MRGSLAVSAYACSACGLKLCSASRSTQTNPCAWRASDPSLLTTYLALLISGKGGSEDLTKAFLSLSIRLPWSASSYRTNARTSPLHNPHALTDSIIRKSVGPLHLTFATLLFRCESPGSGASVELPLGSIPADRRRDREESERSASRHLPQRGES